MTAPSQTVHNARRGVESFPLRLFLAAALFLLVLAACSTQDWGTGGGEGVVKSAMGLGFGPPSVQPPPSEPRPTLDRIGGFKSPTRLALDKDGNLYVTDPGRGWVAVLNPAGERIGTLTGLVSPLGVALQEVKSKVRECVELEHRKRPKVALLAKYCDEMDELGSVSATLGRRGRHHVRIDKEDCRRFEKKRPKKSKVSKISRKRIRKPKKLKKPKKQRKPKKPKIMQRPREMAGRCEGFMVTRSVTKLRVYVGDGGDGSVRVFEEGVRVGSLGRGAGEFETPNGIAAGSNGVVFVADSKAGLVKAYWRGGAFLFSFGRDTDGPGRLDFPTDLALDESAGELYVADWGNGRVVVFDLDGNWLRDIATPLNDGGDEAYHVVAGLGLDPAGNLYVVDNALSCVAVMTREGRLLDLIGYKGGRYWTGDLAVPTDAVSDGRRIYVTSNRTGRVNVFEAVQ